jgi:hypothetical protein
MDLNQIRFLESVENIKALMHQRTGRELSTSRAREITACLQQGRQFYEAAPQSPLEIRPLVQFYGLVGFAKALVLARRLAALSTLARAHGLRDVSAPLARLTELRARVENKGTFIEFNDEVAQVNRACYFGADMNPLSVSIPTAVSASLVGDEISLKDVLARIPSLAKLYRYTFNEPTAAESLHAFYCENDDYFSIGVVDPQPLESRDCLRHILARWRARFPYLAEWRVIEARKDGGESYVTLANLRCASADDLDEASLAEIGGGGFLIRNPIAPDQPAERFALDRILKGVGGGYSETSMSAISPINDKYVSEFSLAYIGLFLLSSLVRYRPDTWAHAVSRTSLQDRPVDDQPLALVQAFLEANLNDVPALVVKLINPNEDRYA